MNQELWIRTRDGSPTIWSNELAEPYRSTRGAFTESWGAYVAPSLEWLQKKGLKKKKLTVGEFGLGPGTNWLLFSLMAHFEKIDFDYFVVEKAPDLFEFARPQWAKEEPLLRTFFEEKAYCWEEGLLSSVLEQRPQVYSNMDEVIEDSQKADLWFHDPFGFSVNPEGYEPELLKKALNAFSDSFCGFSYACNRPFQRVLEGLGLSVETPETGSKCMKRERLAFYWR